MTAINVIRRHAVPVPRYTSYPTANHFSNAVTAHDYRAWLQGLADDARLSLYVHIPYCRELCWYCGCSTKATHRYEPVAHYLDVLSLEVAALAAALPRTRGVSHMHWGGGSPDILKAEDIRRLGDRLRGSFDLLADAEFAVEIDPRILSEDQARAFAGIGVNRASIGVQDFDPAVQAAIARLQDYDATRRAVEHLRSHGIGSINIDLVYGLPHQSEESVARTLEQTLSLAPDRVAVFGYAHLPARIKHQRMIDESALPSAEARFAQSQRIGAMLTQAGYVQLGLDHYAKPQDNLAAKPLRRNFQGYTTDAADALLGLGASAISRLPMGYAQNAVAIDDYERRVRNAGLATARGHRLAGDDAMRAAVIERLMCDFTFSASEMEAKFGTAARALRDDALRIVTEDEDEFVEIAADGFRLTAAGQPFVRNICAKFDAYLTGDVAGRRHALAV